MQISDDGANFGLYLNGHLIYGTTLTENRLAEARGVGVGIENGSGSVTLRDFESHSRSVPVPVELSFDEIRFDAGMRVVVVDDFEGAVDELDGCLTTIGEHRWKRLIGSGRFVLDGSGEARVVGSVAEPCPGRTAYTIDWGSPDFADVEVSITPPGTERGKREMGRGGLIFWQDRDQYIALSVYVDDWYGTSIAAFFHVDGFEELYDAVWTNVGTRIHWGVPYHFRVIFDGERFIAYVNGEPVLYRALSDIYPDWRKLDINAVGLVANWEWGSDTGSKFKHFKARDAG
jgi:hypothetical protein